MTKTENLSRWLKEQSDACGLRAVELSADGRGDEAKFEKIRSNVFEIFRTVLSVSARTHSIEAAALTDFRKKLDQIPANWEAVRENAVRHGDAKAQYIETLKLAAVREIRARLAESLEEGQ